MVADRIETDRLSNKRLQINANREAVTTLKKLIYNITDRLSLDDESMQRRVDAAVKSEYGPVNGLINLLAAIATWPADQGDGSSVAGNKKILEEEFKLDLLLLDDIRIYRGYHTFIADDLTIIAGQEPSYEDYADYCTIFLEDLNIKSYKPTIERTKWQLLETKAKARVEKDIVERQEALAKHREFIASQL